MNQIAKATVAVFAALLLAVPASAAEKPEMPDPTIHRISVPASIGGVSLGQRLKQANRAWGGDGKCSTAVLPDSCFWGNFYDDLDGRAEITTTDGLVDFIEISWNGVLEKGKPDVRKELTRFRTQEGIRLGSKLRKVKDAYPEAKPFKHHSNGDVRAWIISEDGSKMVFGGNTFVNYIVVVPA